MTTETTKTASERAIELNDETRAWLTEGPDRWAGLLVEDPEHWAEQGVLTADDLDRSLLIASYWDCYKEVHGIRPRWMDFSAMTTDEIREDLDALNEIARLEFEAEAEWEALHPFEDNEPEVEEETPAPAPFKMPKQDTAPLTHNPFATLAL